MRGSARTFTAAVAVVILLLGLVYFELSPGPGATKATNSPSTTSASTSASTVHQSSSSQTSSENLGADWLTYHGDNARTGYQAVANFTKVGPAWNSTTLDGDVYAEPLVFGSSVFVATENNSVYALDASDGAILWRTNLGPPVPGSALQCGDINPSGITGTPVIDPLTGTIYAVAFSGLHHTLYALDTTTGAVVFSRSAEPPGFIDTTQQQRSALSLANGMVYVPYGGLAGDCGQYHGWVVGIPANGTGSTSVYQVPTTREGAIWAPSGAAVDSSGTLYVATGNGASTTTFDHGDSVISLSTSLAETGFFAPTNWEQLNGNDADLGSVGPAIVGPGVLFQIGKEGVGYLLNATKLGGIGGQIFSAGVCSESFGGTAYSSPDLFVPCADGLYELGVGSDSFTTAWHAQGFDAGPPIVTDQVVWTVDLSSSALYGFSVTTGVQLYSFPLGGVVHFCTPATGDGMLYVASDDQMMAFSFKSA